MNELRSHHTATLLPEGKVLVAGGANASIPATLGSAELYDPVAGTWSRTGAMAGVRELHTATLLPEGKVLVAGGSRLNVGAIASAELYDPVKGTWSMARYMSVSRHSHSATFLTNGKVLVSSGHGSAALSSSELYDPATDAWRTITSAPLARYSFGSVLLPTGKVLFVGGYDSVSYSSAAHVYDPVQGALQGEWTSSDAMAPGRYGYSATLLPNGKVLVAGGQNTFTALSSAQLYEPTTGTWVATGSLSSERTGHTATLLPNGKVLVTGGKDRAGVELRTAELYDSVSGTWSTTNSLSVARYGHTATLLHGGKVLVSGGRNGAGFIVAAELYDPAAGTWSAAGSFVTSRANHTATVLDSGKVLVTGGYNSSSGTVLASVELYDPAAGTWSATGSMASGRSSHTATLLPGGKVLVVGGISNGTPVSTTEMYDPASGTWSSSSGPARYSHTATLLVSGKVLLVGGMGSFATIFDTCDIYDPLTRTWRGTDTLSVARYVHQAVLLPGGKVLVSGGRDSSGAAISSAEVYDDTSAPDSSRPIISSLSRPAASTVMFSGTGFTGVGDSYDGRGHSATTSFPLMSLSALAGGAPYSLVPLSYSSTSVTINQPVLPEGYYLLSMTVNGVTGSRVLNFKNPSIPAIPIIDTPTEGGHVNSRPSISGTADAFGRVAVSIDGMQVGTTTANAAGAWGFTLTTPLGEGMHTATAIVSDVSGNVSLSSAARSFTVDVSPPAAPFIDSPADGSFVNNARPTLSGVAEAGSTVNLYIDGSRVGTVTVSAAGTWSYMLVSPLAEGSHVLTATATDAAGNESVASIACSFVVDTVAPARPVITSPANGAMVNSGMPTIQGTAEAYSSVAVSIDGGPRVVTADGTGAWSVTASLMQGSHSVVATATDVAGNESEASAELSFVVDTVAPGVPVVTAPASGSLLNDNKPILSGSAEAGSMVRVWLNDVEAGTVTTDPSGNWSFQPAMALGDGVYTLEVVATDLAGNVSAVSAASTFTVDTVAPAIPVVTSPVSGALVNNDKPTIEGTAEANSSVSVSIDGESPQVVTANVFGEWSLEPTTALVEGAHSVRVSARDGAGNESPFSAAITFGVDMTAPASPVWVSPTDGSTLDNGQPTLRGTAEPGTRVLISDNGMRQDMVTTDEAGEWSLTLSSALSDGSHTLTATAEDEAGNVSQPASIILVVDQTPPTVPVVTSPADGSTVKTTTPVLEGAAEAGSTVRVVVDGAVAGTVVASDMGTWSLTLSEPLSEGRHTVSATATDAMGNESAASAEVAFTVSMSTGSGSGCGCASTPASASGLWSLALLALWSVRRRRSVV